MAAQALSRDSSDDRARIVGHVNLRQELTAPGPDTSSDKDFLTNQAACPWTGERLVQDRDRSIAEIAELQSENRWNDIIALFHPVEEKAPALTENGMAGELRLKVGFALCRAGRHAEAINCLNPVAVTEPENAMAHYTLAYTALDALFTARTSRQPLPHREKTGLLKTARHGFEQACRLRPDSVTFFYRHAVLYKEIERKPRRAVPLFEQAVANWEGKDAETRKKQHQQYPKYIKAMYHLASCFLQNGRPGRSFELLEKVLDLDRDRDHMQPVFKHFAMGKVLHVLGRYKQALEHLEVAAYRAAREQPVDFVHELAARCHLLLHCPEKAATSIDCIPPRQRRPYVRWTEADVLVAAGRRQKALQVLAATAERDRRSRHKSLVRMARIQLTLGRCAEAEQSSREAAEFCRDNFGNPSHEALFWQAAALYKLQRPGDALHIIDELEKHHFRYPNFSRLKKLVREAVAPEKGLSLVK